MLLLLLQKPLLPWLLMLYLHILPFLLLCSSYVPTAPTDRDMPPGLMAQVPPTYLALPTGWFSSLPPHPLYLTKSQALYNLLCVGNVG